LVVGGIVLTGGKSRRMGTPKEWLPILGEPMLCRVVRQISQVVSPIVVVAAVDQPLPPLPDPIRIARDLHPDRGPLEGLRVGLHALAQGASPVPTAALVVSCDLPFLNPEFLRRAIAALEAEADAAVPDDGERLHPLAGVYRLSVLTTVERLLATGRRRMLDLCAAIATRPVSASTLREVDANLDSLVNVNSPDDWERVRRRIEGDVER
jgi:molybdenum cofactor guanylyltransferase